MNRSNDLRKMCELPDNEALGVLARQELPNIANDLDADTALLEACRDALWFPEKRFAVLARLNERLEVK